MVNASEQDQKQVIVAQPNLSASWKQNKQMIIFLAIPSIGAALFFWTLGAWPILPFAGLEITALAVSLYYVHWKLHFKHVITFQEGTIRIDKGVYAPKFSYVLARDESSLAIRPENHPWDAPELYIQDRTHSIRVGEFLNRDECLSLQSHLKKQLRISAFGPSFNRDL